MSFMFACMCLDAYDNANDDDDDDDYNDDDDVDGSSSRQLGLTYITKEGRAS